MVHLRIVVPSTRSEKVLDLLDATPSACNLVFLPGAARRPRRRRDPLRRRPRGRQHRDRRPQGARRRAATGRSPSSRSTRRSPTRPRRPSGPPAGCPPTRSSGRRSRRAPRRRTELGGNFLAFMVLACLIASVGIFTGSPILIVGAMVVGPEFGPLAGPLRGDRRAPPRRRPALADRPRRRLPDRDHGGLPVHADLRRHRARSTPTSRASTTR